MCPIPDARHDGRSGLEGHGRLALRDEVRGRHWSIGPAPTVGGMVSSTVLTLVVIPAVYSLWKEHAVRRAEAAVLSLGNHFHPRASV